MQTIAAIATPNGVGAISIVRVSGDRALEVAKKLTKKDLWFDTTEDSLSYVYKCEKQ